MTNSSLVAFGFFYCLLPSSLPLAGIYTWPRPSVTCTDAAVQAYGSRPLLPADAHISAPSLVAPSNVRFALGRGDRVVFQPARVRLAGDHVLLWCLGDADTWLASGSP